MDFGGASSKEGVTEQRTTIEGISTCEERHQVIYASTKTIRTQEEAEQAEAQKIKVHMTEKQFAEGEYNRILRQISSKVGNSETTTSKLSEFGSSMFGDRFVGVFASDKVPKLERGQFLIFNVDDSSKRGTHWLALTPRLVYDSYARRIHRLVPNLHLKQTPTEKDAEQRKDEDNCGARVLAFLCVYYLYGHNTAKWI